MIISVFYISLVTIWAMVSKLRLLPDYIFPSPGDVQLRMMELLEDKLLWVSVVATLKRMAIGFGISVIIGVFLGLAVGRVSWLKDSVGTLFVGVQSLPSVAWVPLALLIFGLDDKAIYFVVIMSSSTGIALAIADGVASINPIYLRAARTLGCTPIETFTRVIIPASLPSIVTGIKLGWTFGWHGVVAAELIRCHLGLGFLLHMGRELNDMSQVLGMMLTIVFIGLVFDRFVFGYAETRIRQRWGLET